MNRITTNLSALLLLAASSAAAAAQPRGVQICGGDYVCTGDPSVVATWPLHRWASVRRQAQQARSHVTPGLAGHASRLAPTVNR